MAATVASICIPDCAKGGSVAITITAAVFLTRMSGRIHGDAHLLQHVGEALRGKQRLLPVAGAFQPHHDAVADQLIVADSFERDQFLEPRGRRVGGRGKLQQQRGRSRISSESRIILES